MNAFLSIYYDDSMKYSLMYLFMRDRNGRRHPENYRHL